MAIRLTCWEIENIGERLSFSSFSQSIDDRWAADLSRPYRIVVLPGYRAPASLDRTHKDALWLEGEVSQPTVAWDGFCPYALFEVIHECFDPAGEATGTIVVQDEAGRVIPDDRSPDILRLRPRRGDMTTRTAPTNRVADLFAWSLLFKRKGGMPGDRRTVVLYDDTIVPGSAHPTSVDSVRRKREYIDRGIANKGPFPRSAWSPDTDHVKRGPPRRTGDSRPHGEPEFKTTIGTLMDIGAGDYSIDVIGDLDKVDGSFYRLAMLHARVPKLRPARRPARPVEPSARKPAPSGTKTAARDSARLLDRIFHRKGAGNPF